MNDIIAFVNNFIQQEYAFLKILTTERDDAKVDAARSTLRVFFADDFSGFTEGPEYRRPTPPDERFFTSGQLKIAKGILIPRTFFQLKKYQHPEHDTIFRVYTSSNHRSDPDRKGYFANFFITQQDGDLRIITRYLLHDPRSRGRVMITDHGLMWAASGGREIHTLGNLIDVHKLEPPTRPADRAEYDAE